MRALSAPGGSPTRRMHSRSAVEPTESVIVDLAPTFSMLLGNLPSTIQLEEVRDLFDETLKVRRHADPAL